MEQIKIRKALPNDLAQLLIFEQHIIEAERPFDSTLKRQDTNYYDLEQMLTAPNVFVAVAELENRIIGSGYARIEKSKEYNQHIHHGYLGFMFVLPEHRGKGVNKMIIDTLKEWVTAQNVNELRLEVYQDNISAIKAYEKIGFTKLMILMRSGLNESQDR